MAYMLIIKRKTSGLDCHHNNKIQMGKKQCKHKDFYKSSIEIISYQSKVDQKKTMKQKPILALTFCRVCNLAICSS